MIKTWYERCLTHPDHEMGMVTHDMIQARMQEEIDDLRAALAQPEQLVVGGDDLPTLTKWTPMAEYAAKSAAVPERAEALKQAGYTRRPRQLPKEDEQEFVLHKWAALFEDPNNDWQAGYESARRWVLEVGLQSIAAPPPRKPLTEDVLKAEFAKLYKSDAAILHLAENNRDYALESIGARHHWTAFKSGVRAIEKAHGIGD